MSMSGAGRPPPDDYVLIGVGDEGWNATPQSVGGGDSDIEGGRGGGVEGGGGVGEEECVEEGDEGEGEDYHDSEGEEEDCYDHDYDYDDCEDYQRNEKNQNRRDKRDTSRDSGEFLINECNRSEGFVR